MFYSNQGSGQEAATSGCFYSQCGEEEPRELGRGHEYLRPSIFWKRPDVAVLCAFSGNTIAFSYSMSVTGAPSKALKVWQSITN